MSIQEQISDLDLKTPLLFMGLAGLSLVFIAYPLMVALGAINLSVVSVFEFYFIDLMTYPLSEELSGTKLTDIIPFKSVFSDLSLLSYVLPEIVLDYTEPLIDLIGTYVERIDVVMGGASIFVLIEALSFAECLFSSKIFLIVPVIVAMIVSPVNLIYLPFTLAAFITALSIISVGSLVASVIFNRPLYQYLRLQSLLYSIVFAALTDMAFICVQSVSTIAIGYILYAITLIPLSYFAYRALTSELPNDCSIIAKLGYSIGSASLVMHIVEASYTVLGAMGYHRCKEIALLLNSKPVQAAVLGVTTTLSILCTGDQLADERYALVASSA